MMTDDKNDEIDELRRETLAAFNSVSSMLENPPRVFDPFLGEAVAGLLQVMLPMAKRLELLEGPIKGKTG